jgi:hypothetical protein
MESVCKEVSVDRHLAFRVMRVCPGDTGWNRRDDFSVVRRRWSCVDHSEKITRYSGGVTRPDKEVDGRVGLTATSAVVQRKATAAIRTLRKDSPFD